MPGFVLCHQCIQLHRIDPLEGPKQPYKWDQERQCVREAGNINYHASDYFLQYKHLRLVMNAHRYGPCYGIPLDALSHVYSWECRADALRVRVQPQVVLEDKLLLKVTSKVVMRRDRDIRYVKEHIMEICPHLIAHFADNYLSHLVACLLGHTGNRPCDYCGGLKQCLYCHTEFEIELEAFEKGGGVVVFTVWYDFGQGKTPADPKWRAHVHNTYDNNTIIANSSSLNG